MQKDRLDVDRRFEELTAHIRFTDEVSFKLLGFVPLLSVTGIAAVLLKGDARFSPLLMLLSLFAAVITWALFAWELRNIQMCSWCRDRAAELESDSEDLPLAAGHFSRFPDAFRKLGKTAAEKVVYSSTVFAWLLLPIVSEVSTKNLETRPIELLTWWLYLPCAAVVAVATVLLLRARISLEPKPLTNNRNTKKAPNPYEAPDGQGTDAP